MKKFENLIKNFIIIIYIFFFHKKFIDTFFQQTDIIFNFDFYICCKFS